MSSIHHRLLAPPIAALVAVAGLAVAAPPVAAEADGFLDAETARIERMLTLVAQVPDTPVLTRADIHTQRAELLADQAAKTFALGALESRRASLAKVESRLGAVESVRVIDVRAKKLRADLVALENDLTTLEAQALFPGALADFGLDFAVFPVLEPSEFVNSWGAARSGGRGHKGTDILGPHGTELLAIEDGVIERVSNSALGGLSLYLIGDSGARYYYAHLATLADYDGGDRVHAGAVIGYNGDSGNARGTPHLHFQYAPNGGNGWVNPFPLLETLWTVERQAALPTR